MSKFPGPWEPYRHWLFLWRLEHIVMQDWAGTGIAYLKHKNGLVRLFWTRKQAQAYADKLNEKVNL